MRNTFNQIVCCTENTTLFEFKQANADLSECITPSIKLFEYRKYRAI